MPTPESFRHRLAAADPALAADLQQTLDGQVAARGGHREWGLLTEAAGLFPLALREFQLALRDEPGDAVAAARLAHHYRERGEADKALVLLEGLVEREPANVAWLRPYVELLLEEGAAPRARAALARATALGLGADVATSLARLAPPAEEPAPEPADLTPNDADCARMHHLFAGREGVHARQWAGPGGVGGYTPVHEPLTPAVLRQHLLGSCTVGVYPLRLDDTCTFFALDLDVDKQALEKARSQPAYAREVRTALRAEARRLLDWLRAQGTAPLFEDSGHKGRHFWVFLEQPAPAEVLHRLGRQVLGCLTPQVPRGLHLEFFPKQATRSGKGLGNLIKLPLGIHRRTGRRALLLDDDGQPLADPFRALRSVRRLPEAGLHAVIERLKGVVPLPTSAPSGLDPSVPAGPPPPDVAPAWTEADFEADPRVRHLLRHCPVLTALKRQVDEQRRLTLDEQLVLIHTLGHLDGGPQAVNYLFSKCPEVGTEKYLKDRLKGNPVSCPSIRKKIGHLTRRVACNCPFEFAQDRYPTPVLHLLTLPKTEQVPAPATPGAGLDALARRYAVSLRRKEELEREHQGLVQAFVALLKAAPDQVAHAPGGHYRLVVAEGVEEIVWEEEKT